MAPTSHDPSSDCNEAGSRKLEKKPVPGLPAAPALPGSRNQASSTRESPRNSFTDENDADDDEDDEDEEEDRLGFLGKLCKFEMLASGKVGNYVSPKVFPLGASTTNVPAERILVGRTSRSSSLVSLSKRVAPVVTDSRYSPSRTVASTIVRSIENSENDDPRVSLSSNQLATRMVEPREPNRRFGTSNPGNPRCNDDFDTSLLLAKTTTTTEFLRLDKFGVEIQSNSRRGNDNRSPLNTTCNSINVSKRIQPLSPAFNRDPRYDESKSPNKVQTSLTSNLVTPTASVVPVEIPDEKRRRRSTGGQAETERRRKLAQEERLREQEIERRERSRLEEILAMCAEYERQSATLENRPRQPNRIKTNGSLPRDGRPGYYSPFGSPESPIRSQRRQQNQHQHQPYFPIDPRSEEKGIDNANNNRNASETTRTTSSNVSNNCHHGVDNNNGSDQSIIEDVFSGSISRATRKYDKGWPGWSREEDQRLQQSTRHQQSQRRNSCELEETVFEAIRLNGTRIDSLPRSRQQLADRRDRFVDDRTGSKDVDFLDEKIDGRDQRVNASNNNRLGNVPALVASFTRRNENLPNTCQIIENKLTASNERLIDAMQARLSDLTTKSSNDGDADDNEETAEITATPKRNNAERDNARSNEAKADRERQRLDEQDRTKYLEFLRNERTHVLGNMDVLERSIADIELQEEEIDRELELEKALLSAEYDSESLELTSDESNMTKTRGRIDELEREMALDRESQAKLQEVAKHRVQRAQIACLRLEDELASCGNMGNDRYDDDNENDQDDSRWYMRREIIDKLAVQQDILETERKAFEDLEFHHLEEEASKLATREELQRHLSELSARIEARRLQLEHLATQRSTVKTSATRDTNGLERQKLAHVKKLQEARTRLRAIEDELENLSRSDGKSEETKEDDKRSPSRQDFDRISRVTTDSPITVAVDSNQGSLGRKTIESLKEIERNRQLHLAKQGSQVISEERRRVEELKRRVQDEVRYRWEQERRNNRASFNSLESSEESSNYSTGLTESGSGSSDGAEIPAADKSDKELTIFGSSTAPAAESSSDGYALPHGHDIRERNERSVVSSEESRLVTIDETESSVTGDVDRPLSQTSSDTMESLAPLVHRSSVKHRENKATKLRRPLTRYLPIKSESLDLRNHIETAGHQLSLIQDVTLDSTSCSGYLSKMSKKFHHWNKRWFVFDRKRKTLSYYGDCASSINGKKARGLVYFQSIEEVYVDHMNTVRSPQPSLTFVVKTTTRLYHLMAPSPEAMRVWVDVVFTGAEGYHEFDHAP